MRGAENQQTGVAEVAFPWTLYSSIALRGLCWTPEIFWQSTPREVCMAFAVNQQISPPLDRATLDQLQHAFPDEGQSQQL